MPAGDACPQGHIIWRTWRELGQTLQEFESKGDPGPGPKHEELWKDQTVIIKIKHALEAPESHCGHSG